MTELSSRDSGPPPTNRLVRRRAGRAGFVGSMIEYYDFLVYGFLAVTIAPQFFPADDPAASMLAALAVYGAGYVARPLGGFFFGWLGDRRGRRDALVLTVLIMGLATAMLGLVPVHAQAGLLAPALLVVARLVQGFAAGGELVGAVTYLGEVSEGRRRGVLMSVGPLGSGAGAALAPIVVGTTTFLVGAEAMTAWGWRIPFLVAIPLLIASLVLRLRLEDSAEFRRLVERAGVERFPLARVLREHKRSVLQVFVLATAAMVPPFLAVIYMNIYLIQGVGLPQTTVYWLSAVVLLAALPAFFVGGVAIDRFGVRRTLCVVFLACPVVIYPAMLLMAGTENILVIGLLYFAAAVCNYALSAPAYAAFVSVFPAPVRYSGSALGWNFGAIAGAGVSPVVAGLLVSATGDPTAPALLIFVGAALGLATLATMTSLRRTPEPEVVLAVASS